MTPEERKNSEAIEYPVSFSCVDMIAYARSLKHFKITSIAMITKDTGSTKFRLPGGFIDPTDISPSDAASRELSEEIGLIDSVCKDEHLSMLTMDKGRYSPAESKHRLRTYLFSTEVGCIPPKLTAGDDAATATWIPISKFQDAEWVLNNIIEGHIPLIFWFLGKKGVFIC